MIVLRALRGREVLDSRGRPTVAATCAFDDGTSAAVSVPSGASTGRAEAHELRDGDDSRYAGFGCRNAAANVATISAALAGQHFADQHHFDNALIELDGTANKSHLGANAILAASLAFARATAHQRNVPLFVLFAELAQMDRPTRLPRMTINLFSGGKHAGGQVPLQDVLLVPLAESIDGGLVQTAAVYQAASAIIAERYGARPLVADEGGLAPAFENVDAMLQCAVDAIVRAGLTPGSDVALAIDVASSHFYDGGRYRVERDEVVDAQGMITLLDRWAATYPLVSIEDGLAEDDWSNWPHLRTALARRGVLTLGDDLLCTNPDRIARAIEVEAADALLLKVNQIGTVSEAATALQLARSAGWRVTVSARSGETEDDWLADLAVGWSGDQIKIGSIVRSERLAKYNRLLEIEAGSELAVTDWPRVQQAWAASS